MQQYLHTVFSYTSYVVYFVNNTASLNLQLEELQFVSCYHFVFKCLPLARVSYCPSSRCNTSLFCVSPQLFSSYNQSVCCLQAETIGRYMHEHEGASLGIKTVDKESCANTNTKLHHSPSCCCVRDLSCTGQPHESINISSILT